ncbi:nitroreductase family protein [Amycolatopsis australiensis]|uniref:nitroreductase family protein n=1 Tax=Amycolatopsis australiensis TaxID=546364 RepID=UPI000A037A2C|nr:nitroreductase family protein [Amycolatopsis australiensis]
MRARRTVRHYRPDPVPAALLEELLELAVEAPSAWNMQDRSIVVVTGETGREGLSWAAGGQPQPAEAPVCLVFVAEPEAWREDHADVAERAADAGAWNAEFAAMFDSRAEFHDLAERGLLRENAILAPIACPWRRLGPPRGRPGRHGPGGLCAAGARSGRRSRRRTRPRTRYRRRRRSRCRSAAVPSAPRCARTAASSNRTGGRGRAATRGGRRAPTGDHGLDGEGQRGGERVERRLFLGLVPGQDQGEEEQR